MIVDLLPTFSIILNGAAAVTLITQYMQRHKTKAEAQKTTADAASQVNADILRWADTLRKDIEDSKRLHRTEMEELRKELNSLKEENESLRVENSTLKSRVAHLEAQMR